MTAIPTLISMWLWQIKLKLWNLGKSITKFQFSILKHLRRLLPGVMEHQWRICRSLSRDFQSSSNEPCSNAARQIYRLLKGGSPLSGDPPAWSATNGKVALL